MSMFDGLQPTSWLSKQFFCTRYGTIYQFCSTAEPHVSTADFIISSGLRAMWTSKTPAEWWWMNSYLSVPWNTMCNIHLFVHMLTLLMWSSRFLMSSNKSYLLRRCQPFVIPLQPSLHFLHGGIYFKTRCPKWKMSLKPVSVSLKIISSRSCTFWHTILLWVGHI